MKCKKFVTYGKKIFSTDINDRNVFKLYHKVRDHCNYTGKFREAAHSICNLRYKTPKEILVVFHSGSLQMIIQLAKELDGEFECLGENILLFQYQLKKNLIIPNQLRTN